jgi:hypothetical protein
MRSIKTMASALIVGLALINLLPIEEVAKVTRLLPDNFFSNRSEIQFIDQEIRGAVRRYARSEERNGANAQYSDDGTQASIVKNSSKVLRY